MNLRKNISDEIEDPVLDPALDPALAQALKHFKASVDAWSEAAYQRPRTAVRVARHGWRLAASWALAGVLAACAVAGVAYERQHRQELAHAAAVKAAAQRAQQEQAAEQAKQAAEKERARVEQVAVAKPSVAQDANAGDEDLLATVDKDVSQQVPAAMEPLAELMDGSGTPDSGTQ
jgi:cell division protein FtsL